MKLSKHNIISAIADSENYFVVNLLSQEADILTSENYKSILSGKYQDTDELVQKGYLVDPVQEEKLYRKKYLEFLDKRDGDEIQIFYVPSYTCNFACSYCYQDEYAIKNKPEGKELIHYFYRYIDSQFSDRRKYITVFGGEPLLDSAWHRQNLTLLLEEAAVRNLDVAIVTNGYHLSSYMDILKKASIREIQVTLDGMETGAGR